MVFAALVGMALIQGPSTPLSGTVVAEDGTPVVGAELVLTSPGPGESPVVARGKSGEGGAFRFDRPTGLAATSSLLIPTLWTIAPGHRVSVRRFTGGVPGGDEPVRVVLGPPARTEIHVESPDGAPVAGARLRVQRIKSEPLPAPEPVIDVAERATGPDGVAVLDAFGPEDVGAVDAIAKGYGIQPRWLDPDAPGPKRITLRPVVALKGRLVPDKVDPKLAKGWRIRAWTREAQVDPRANGMAGYGSATTDDAGRFAIAELAPGSLSLAMSPPGESELLPDLTKIPPVREGRDNSLEIPIRRASTISGVVREQGTAKPVAGLLISLFRPSRSGTEYGTTDAEGRFSFRSLAGKARLYASESPPGYVSAAGTFGRDVEVPEGAGRVDAGTFELVKAAPPIRGEVRDEAGRPVAGAEIAIRWTMKTPRGNPGFSSSTKADDRGGFALEGLAPGARVEITARYRDRATAAPKTIDVGAEGPVIVMVAPRPVVAVAGRVLGPGGEPMVGTVVRIKGRETVPGRASFGKPVSLQGNPTIRTGPDGTFHSPRELDRENHEYQAEVAVPGYHPAQTVWTTPREDDVLTLPDLALRRSQSLRTVSGRVIDHEGRPVVGASVFQTGDGPSRTEATTDNAGRFRLPGVYDGRALVFAERAGFRFGGAVVGPGGEDVEVRLAREGEPPIARLATLPPPMSRAEERALGRELLAPVLPEARSGALGHVGQKAIPSLARLDPDRVLTMLENRVLANSSPVLAQVALAQLEDDPREAVATIEADRDPGSRASGLLALADALPAADRARRVEWLDRALAEARRAAGAEAKLSLLGEIADRWLDLSDVGRAAPILREGKAVFDAIPKDRYVYQAETFAEILAATDLPAARAIFERKGMTHVSAPDDQTIRRHLGEAARRLAAIDPAEAERLTALPPGGPNLGDRETRDFRIARRMARTDLPRARKLLATIAERPENPTFARPALVPYGLGLIASDLAATDPAVARGLLDEAFAGLLKLARGSDSRGRMSTPILMAALLPTVERVDPDRVAERLWSAASCRVPRTQEPFAHDVMEMATLAMLAARYDRAMAAAIAAPALERLPSLLDRTDGRGYSDGRAFGALAAYDPRTIAPLIRALPAAARETVKPKDGNPIVSSEAVARLEAAEMLGLPIEARRREALRKSGDATAELPAAR